MLLQAPGAKETLTFEVSESVPEASVRMTRPVVLSKFAESTMAGRPSTVTM